MSALCVNLGIQTGDYFVNVLGGGFEKIAKLHADRGTSFDLSNDVSGRKTTRIIQRQKNRVVRAPMPLEPSL
jgi:hypothetical protein